MIEKINKLSVPATILIASVVIGGFYLASQLNKQSSIERQQQAELQQKTLLASEQAVQKDREFDASQKEGCLAIYKQESTKWNNTTSWRYDSEENRCYIEYKVSEKKTEAQCNAEYKDDDGKVYPFFFKDWLLCLDGRFEKSF